MSKKNDHDTRAGDRAREREYVRALSRGELIRVEDVEVDWDKFVLSFAYYLLPEWAKNYLKEVEKGRVNDEKRPSRET